MISEEMLASLVEQWNTVSGGREGDPVIVMRPDDFLKFSRSVERPDVNGMSFGGTAIFIRDDVPEDEVFVMSRSDFEQRFPDDE